MVITDLSTCDDHAEDGHFSRGAVLWLTGLSGAGKTTIAAEVVARIGRYRSRVEYLDGDVVRQFLPRTGYDRIARNEHIRRMGHLASRLEHHGVLVVAAFVSPYRESRDFVRSLCRTFVEVYVSTPLQTCQSRDVKGLYAKAGRSEIRQFTGIDDPYDVPPAPEIDIDCSVMTVDLAVSQIIAYLADLGLLGRQPQQQQQPAPAGLEKATFADDRTATGPAVRSV